MTLAELALGIFLTGPAYLTGLWGTKAVVKAGKTLQQLRVRADHVGVHVRLERQLDGTYTRWHSRSPLRGVECWDN